MKAIIRRNAIVEAMMNQDVAEL